jgi:hypothetical protein
MMVSKQVAKILVLTAGILLFVATASYAAPVTYVLSTPGVV